MVVQSLTLMLESRTGFEKALNWARAYRPYRVIVSEHRTEKSFGRWSMWAWAWIIGCVLAGPLSAQPASVGAPLSRVGCRLDGAGCGSGSGSGITSLNGLTGGTQTFSMGAGLAVSSSGTAHTFSIGNGLSYASSIFRPSTDAGSALGSDTVGWSSVYAAQASGGTLPLFSARLGSSLVFDISGTATTNVTTSLVYGASGANAFNIWRGEIGGSLAWTISGNAFNLTPGSDDSADLGSASLRVRKVYANVVSLGGFTVATLPAGATGDTAYVTDALAPAYLTAVVGGGAVVTPVFYDGAAWVAH